jgi:hypothetical protein
MKIGDYVRFKNGEIEKIHSFAEKDNPLFNILINARYHNTNEIKKHGELIGLIEVGDYVNGYKVNAEYAPYGVYIEIPFVDSESIGCNVDLIRTEEIESIVTHEQFKSMEYKVGE